MLLAVGCCGGSDACVGLWAMAMVGRTRLVRKDVVLLRRFQGVGSYGTVGLDFAVSVTFCFLGGWWLDGKLGTAPWLMMVGLVLGTVVGFSMVFKAARKMRDEAEREERESAGADGSEDGSGG